MSHSSRSSKSDDLDYFERLYRDVLTRTEQNPSPQSLMDMVCFLEIRVPQLLQACRELQSRLRDHRLDARIFINSGETSPAFRFQTTENS